MVTIEKRDHVPYSRLYSQGANFRFFREEKGAREN